MATPTVRIPTMQHDTVVSASPAAPAPAMQPDRLILPPRYEARRKVARGGMAVIHEVWDRKLGRSVAMKLLPRDAARNAFLLARFDNEIRIHAGLSHPAIVPLLDGGVTPDGRPYLVMRLLRGPTLNEAIGEHHRASRGVSNAGWRAGLIELVAALSDICDALSYAHNHGVIHGDVKPHNIVLDGELGAVLLDWGLARATGLRRRSGSARADRVVSGTAPFMPPEQCRGYGDLLGPRADVYALGAVLYHVIAGQPPYADSEDWSTALEQVRLGPPEPVNMVAARRGAVPPPGALERVVNRAMARPQWQRPPNAGQIRAELEAWLQPFTARPWPDEAGLLPAKGPS